MPNKFYSLPKSVFEYYHAKLKDWVRAVLPTKTSDLTNDSDFLDQLALAGIIASTFSTSSTYAVGDYVLYNHTLYRCKTAISTAGAWDSSKWDATKTQDIFQGSTPGLVPAAESGDADKVLKGDGTWGVVSGGSTARVSYNAKTEELSLDFSPPPADSVFINSRYYHYVQVGNLYWLDENLNEEVGTYITSPNADTGYNYLYNHDTCVGSALRNIIPNGWRIPTRSDYSDLLTAISGTSNEDLFSDSIGKSDVYGLKLLRGGNRRNNAIEDPDYFCMFLGYESPSTYFAKIACDWTQLRDPTSWYGVDSVNNFLPIRLVKTLT